MNPKIRLQKYLADCGVCSRRKAEEYIAGGLVRVNGKTAVIGEQIDPKHDIVTLRGKKIHLKKEHTYLALHKPRGFVSTMNDENGRKCVAQLVADVGTRVYPVGRLDKDSEGLLLMTDDGELANALAHPSGHVEKVYRVTIRPGITEEQIRLLSEGILLDGKMTLPATIQVLTREDDRTVLKIILREGRNRQIRRMLESLQIETIRLKRIAIGQVRLGTLKAGQWRHLTENEVLSLKKSAGLVCKG